MNQQTRHDSGINSKIKEPAKLESPDTEAFESSSRTLPRIDLQSPLPSAAAHMLSQQAEDPKGDAQQRETIHADNNEYQMPPAPTSHTPLTTSSTAHHAKLQAQISSLQSAISSTQSQLDSTLSQLSRISSPITSTDVNIDASANADGDGPSSTSEELLTHASGTLKHHIRLLSTYNAIKDTALMLLGIIAERDGKRLAEVIAEKGISEED